VVSIILNIDLTLLNQSLQNSCECFEKLKKDKNPKTFFQKSYGPVPLEDVCSQDIKLILNSSNWCIYKCIILLIESLIKYSEPCFPVDVYTAWLPALFECVLKHGTEL
jgi:hypothetical protein